MLSTVLDKLGGLFGKRFLLCCWAPVFVVCSAGVLLMVWVGDPGAWLSVWNGLDTVAQVWVSVGALIAVTVIAYVLEGLQGLIVRLYEGYWPDWPPMSWLKGIGIGFQGWKRKRLRSEQQYGLFPPLSSDRELMPTALGNVLRSAEAAPWAMYRIDAVLWWPRLIAVAPQAMREGVQQSLTPILALLNLATLSGLFGVSAGVAVICYDSSLLWLAGAVLGGDIALAWLSYAGAVRQATEYGQLVRTAFDLYRHDLIRALHIPLPRELTEEWKLWLGLNDWLHVTHRPPWETWQALAQERRSSVPTTLKYNHGDES
jgi:hypothetical protein